MPEKNVIFSKRIQGSIVMLIALIATSMGLDFEQAQLETQVAAVFAGLGWIWNLYGSWKAEHKLTVRAPKG